MALRFYKHGQGKISRGIAALAVGLLGGFGCYRLYLWLGAFERFRTPLFPGNPLGSDVPINLALLISVGLVTLLAGGLYVLSNRPRVADFLMETEAELNKVSWPSRQEVVGSSIIVIVVVFMLASYILAVDLVLAKAQDLWTLLADLLLGK